MYGGYGGAEQGGTYSNAPSPHNDTHLGQNPAQRFGIAARIVDGIVGVRRLAAFFPRIGGERLAAPAGVEIANAPGAESCRVFAQECVAIPVPELPVEGGVIRPDGRALSLCVLDHPGAGGGHDLVRIGVALLGFEADGGHGARLLQPRIIDHWRHFAQERFARIDQPNQSERDHVVAPRAWPVGFNIEHKMGGPVCHERGVALVCSIGHRRRAQAPPQSARDRDGQIT